MLPQVQMVDEIMRGLVNTPMENLDNFITSEVTKHLFEERGHPFSGLDLVSLNIQRGGRAVIGAGCIVQKCQKAVAFRSYSAMN